MSELRQSRRAWYAGGAAAAAALIALGWFVVIGPETASTASIKNQTADAATQNLVLRGKVSSLKAQDKKLPTLLSQLAEVQRELPSGSGMSAYLTQVMAQAQAAGVTLTSVTAGAPTVVTSGTAASAIVANPAGHLFSIPVNLVGDGSLAQQRKLLTAIQTAGPRRSLVISVGYTPVTAATSGGSAVQSIDVHTTMSVKLQVFVAPQSPADEAALKQLSSATP
ncbi:MAG: hypothetical protein M3Y42_14925 [Actinomycetota bacterium]|nr:hypothetical protein [Actinomycetota bacterium]MDQ2958244.1 hypothetical protein [Actinomycetota bacterium]